MDGRIIVPPNSGLGLPRERDCSSTARSSRRFVQSTTPVSLFPSPTSISGSCQCHRFKFDSLAAPTLTWVCRWTCFRRRPCSPGLTSPEKKRATHGLPVGLSGVLTSDRSPSAFSIDSFTRRSRMLQAINREYPERTLSKEGVNRAQKNNVGDSCSIDIRIDARRTLANRRNSGGNRSRFSYQPPTASNKPNP